MLLRVYLDYKSMVAHDFIVKNREGELKYQLFFNKHHPETITLPAPSLFDLSSGTYLVPLKAIHAYRNPAPAMEPEPEPQVDPSRQSNYQWDPEMIVSSGNRSLPLLHRSTTPTIIMDIHQAKCGHIPT